MPPLSKFATPTGGWPSLVLVIKNSPTASKISKVVVTSYRLPLTGPKAIMTHQDVAGGHSRLMGSQPEKVDFWAIPKLG